MAEPFAVVQDVEILGKWEITDNLERAQVERLLRRASNLLRSKAAGLDERIAAGTVDIRDARDTAAAMVLRSIKLPFGLESQAETIGPQSHQQTFHQRASSDDLYVTKAELAPLQAPSSSRRVGTIRLGAGLA